MSVTLKWLLLIFSLNLVVNQSQSTSQSFRRDSGHPHWHHGIFHDVRESVRSDVRPMLHSRVEVPFQVPLEVNVVLLGLLHCTRRSEEASAEDLDGPKLSRVSVEAIQSVSRSLGEVFAVGSYVNESPPIGTPRQHLGNSPVAVGARTANLVGTANLGIGV